MDIWSNDLKGDLSCYVFPFNGNYITWVKNISVRWCGKSQTEKVVAFLYTKCEE